MFLKPLIRNPNIEVGDYSYYDHSDNALGFEQDVMKNEVLSKRRKALMLFGIGHLLHGEDTAVRYEQQYPNVTFTVDPAPRFRQGQRPADGRMMSWPIPALAPFKGHLARQAALLVLHPEGTGLPTDGTGNLGADGYLYVGPRGHLLREPISARTGLDSEYIAELERRAEAVKAPPDSLLHPEVIFQRELRSSVLQYDPGGP